MSSESRYDDFVRYQPLNWNVDLHFLNMKGKEYHRRNRKCERAFRQFEETRGRVLSDAIAVEKELDLTIATYFVPRKSAVDNVRFNAFVDLILGQEGFSFNAKTETVVTLLDVAEIRSPTKTGLRNILNPVMRDRNKVAHRRVGIDWTKFTVSLWDSKGRKWEVLAEDFGDTFTQRCREAIATVDSILGEVRNLRTDDA